MRLDEALVKKGLVDSRSKAKELIKQSKIKVNSKIVTKPSYGVQDSDEIELLQDKIYVSRAALKLKNYITETGFSFKNKSVLDIGASTGGFSEVALESGAKKVVCVDVGTNQLHERIKSDPRVENYEKTDFRDFEDNRKFDVILSDVSFISLLKLIKNIDKYAKKDIILLFKPQFEVGKDAKRDKKGVVIDTEAIKNARANFEEECKKLGWRLVDSRESSIKGKEGNTEYVYHFKKES